MTQPRDTPPNPSPVRLHKDLAAIWDTPGGFGRLAAVNHTVVGRRFIITALVFFVIGGALAMLMRAQLASPASAFMSEGRYAQMFTMHGTVMMFLFAIPLLEGVAIYFLPKMLGARDMAFPRLSAFAYWCFLFGGLMLIGSLVIGLAPDTGWFMYTPLSGPVFSPGINADFWLLGVTFVEISAIATAVEIIVSVLKARTPGMALGQMPIFAWYMLVVGAMMLLGFPPLILGSILLEVERAFGLPFFDPERGGDPLLWQHLFWLFGHPEVYIIFLPAAGVISTILPVFCNRPLVAYSAVVVAVVALALLSFLIWVHHMYTVGIPHLALTFFSAASALIAIPTAVQIFAWLATMAHGRPRLSTPMLYVFGFFFIFTMGGLTGVMLAIVPFNLQVHDTHFVVAHLHYVLVGGFIFPMLAALYYWLPQMTGRIARHHLSKAAFWLIFVGFNTTFFLMHLTGLLGMPRRIHTYGADSGWETLNLISSIGSFILTMGFALIVVDIVLHIRFGRRSRRNHWGAGTLEWACPTPIPSYSIASQPHVDKRADMLDPGKLGADLAAGRGYLGRARNGWMETMGVETVSGRAEQVIILPRQSHLPLWTAVATGLFFLAVLTQVYWAAPVALGLVLVTALGWTRKHGFTHDLGPLPIRAGEAAPPHSECPDAAPSRWGLTLTLIADATLYATLLFSALYLWGIGPNWPPQRVPEFAPLLLVLAAAAMAGSALTARRALTCAGGGAEPWLLGGSVLQGCATAVLGWLTVVAVPDWQHHALSATTVVVLIYAAFHTFVGMVFSLYGLWRVRTGYVSALRTLDLRLGRIWHDFTAGAGIVALAFVVTLAHLAAP